MQKHSGSGAGPAGAGLDGHTLRVLFTCLIFALGLGFVYLAWRTLLFFVFALLFAYLLEPLVELVERAGVRRGTAVAAIYVVLLAVSGAVFFFLIPVVAHQAARLKQLLPEFSRRVDSGEIVRRLGLPPAWSDATQEHLQLFLAQHNQVLSDWREAALAGVASMAGYLTWLALVPIFAVLFLLGGHRFAEAFLAQLSRRSQRVFFRALLQDMHAVLAGFMRAQVILTTLAVLVYCAGFELLRLPFALALAVAAGALEFIPVAGPLTAAVLVLAYAFLLDYPHLWVLVLFLGSWRLVQDYVNSPRIMSGQVRLPPLAVLFGIAAGAEVAGGVGVFLSVPALAILSLLWRRWYGHEAGRASGSGKAQPYGSPAQT